jgi:hypothetical protein
MLRKAQGHAWTGFLHPKHATIYGAGRANSHQESIERLCETQRQPEKKAAQQCSVYVET